MLKIGCLIVADGHNLSQHSGLPEEPSYHSNDDSLQLHKIGSSRRYWCILHPVDENGHQVGSEFELRDEDTDACFHHFVGIPDGSIPAWGVVLYVGQ